MSFISIIARNLRIVRNFIKDNKKDPLGHFLSAIGARDETRTHNPVKEADFKSAAYTNSATRAGTVIVEVRTRVALV